MFQPQLIKGTHPELSLGVRRCLAPSSEKKLSLHSGAAPPPCCRLSQGRRIRPAGLSPACSRATPAQAGLAERGLTPKQPRDISGPAALHGVFFPGIRKGSEGRACFSPHCLLSRGTAWHGREIMFSPSLCCHLFVSSPVRWLYLVPPHRGTFLEPPAPAPWESCHLSVPFPALAVASEERVALSGFKWLSHNTDCQPR